MCRECKLLLQKNNTIIPKGLANDNWIGYVDAWIYRNEVTWMEKTVSTKYWTGLMLFSIDVRHSQRSSRTKHKMHDPLYQIDGRIAYKGQLFSAPMDWNNMVDQLEKMGNHEVHVSLPVTGAVLASRVRLVIASGLVDLNKLLKQATVRKHIVLALIALQRDAGHPDYQQLNMREVAENAEELASSDAAVLPNGLAEFFECVDGEDKPFLGVDKAATPAEKIYNFDGLESELDRARPLLLSCQRDSDVSKDVSASRVNAFANFSEMELRTGSNLIDQFETSYIPRVFNITLPWCVGGPDFANKTRHRRYFDDSPGVSLHMYDAMMASRVEAQIRQDWDFGPGIHSLSFATKVSQGISMSINRVLRRSGDSMPSGSEIGRSVSRIYELLWEGEYLDNDGNKKKSMVACPKYHKSLDSQLQKKHCCKIITS